jgi:hypothetical protein
MAMERKANKQRRSHLRVAKHAAPFCERQVGGDHDAGGKAKFQQRWSLSVWNARIEVGIGWA